jgi:hypothetical protein
MFEFLLMVQVCTAYDAGCQWQRMGSFANEERCVANGLAIDPAVVRFKCVMIEHSTRAQVIPLPRPRPKLPRPLEEER